MIKRFLMSGRSGFYFSVIERGHFSNPGNTRFHHLTSPHYKYVVKLSTTPSVLATAQNRRNALRSAFHICYCCFRVVSRACSQA